MLRKDANITFDDLDAKMAIAMLAEQADHLNTPRIAILISRLPDGYDSRNMATFLDSRKIEIRIFKDEKEALRFLEVLN